MWTGKAELGNPTLHGLSNIGKEIIIIWRGKNEK